MKCRTFDIRVRLIRRYKAAGRLLDVGCATGIFLHVAQQHGFEVFGVELSEFAVALARGKFGMHRVHHGRLEDCPFPPGSFDAVTMSDLLEHVKEPVPALRKARQLLKDDGLVVVATPDTGSLSCRLMRAKWSHRKYEHLFYFNRRAMRELARRSGFHLVADRVCYKALNLFYLYFQFRAYRHRVFTPASGLLYRFLPQNVLAWNCLLPAGERVFILRKSGPSHCTSEA